MKSWEIVCNLAVELVLEDHDVNCLSQTLTSHTYIRPKLHGSLGLV